MDVPYPIAVSATPFSTGEVPPGGGPETFDQPEALRINKARMDHLASLNLDLRGKSVLDVGAGVGHLGNELTKWGAKVHAVDGRAENVESLRLRYPHIEASQANVETTPLGPLGSFDAVFCYGLLYHLENIMMALRNIASACRDLLLIETIIIDHQKPILLLEEETFAFSQALQGLAHRASPSYLVLALHRLGFPHIYAPRHVPDYPDYKFKWRNDLASARDGHNLRCIFVAARGPLQNPNLISLLPARKG